MLFGSRDTCLHALANSIDFDLPENRFSYMSAAGDRKTASRNIISFKESFTWRDTFLTRAKQNKKIRVTGMEAAGDQILQKF